MSEEENDDFLSQDEIDALINDDNSSGSDSDDTTLSEDESGRLTEQEKDVMGEVGNIAMGSAATALYTLMDKKVEITSPRVDTRPFDEVSNQYDRPIVLVDVEYTEGLKGYNLLVIKEEDAAIIADLMMGGDGSDPDGELSELHISAVGEAMNQMMGSASTALSSVIDARVNITPPEARYLDIDEVIDDDKFFDAGDMLAVISFDLKIGDLIDSQFQQLAPVGFVHHLVEELVGDERGLTAKDEEAEVDPAAEAMQKLEKTGGAVEAPEEKEQKTSRAGEEVAADRQEQAAAAGGAASGASSSMQRGEAGSGRVSSEEEVGVQKAEFPGFEEEGEQSLPQNMELIKDVPLQVTVRLGKSRMTIEEILDLGEGSIIELDKLAGETVDLLVNGKLVAKGEVVVIDENFGFRVKDIVSPRERLNNI